MQIFKKRLALSFIVTLVLLVLSGFFFSPALFAAETNAQAEATASGNIMWVVISAAVAFSFGAGAAGFAISRVGAAAMGAMSEKPEIGAQALIFIALAEGLVVFGFITALMILGKV
ncbi:MAG: ATP synthase subunit C [Sphaerochaetaceae bacterium]|jgi:V/A-type H+-transporting ATPase subunit K|nr:ATP synthase subunit C [Sphaerochaetaceae bacterium]